MPQAPLQLQMLTVNHVLRWQGDCTENVQGSVDPHRLYLLEKASERLPKGFQTARKDKGLVLCERITVAPETGDLSASMPLRSKAT